MKYRKFFLIMTLAVILFFNDTQMVRASANGFSTKELSDEEQRKILNNIHISILDKIPRKAAIKCFDVNENGLIAIGSSDSEKKTICIYSAEGIFLYGYQFSTPGSFGLAWENDSIIIYFVRSALAVTVNASGEVENILRIEETPENSAYRRDVVFSTTRVVGDYEYIIKNDGGILDFFAATYSKLVVINGAGEENIIYDVSSELSIKRTIILIAVVLYIGVAVIVLARQIIKLRRED